MRTTLATPMCVLIPAFAVLTACGGESRPNATTAPSTPTTPAPTPAISLGLSEAAVSLLQGQTSSVTITLTRSGGFAGPVDLSADGMPNGLTATFASASLAGGVVSTTVSIGATQAAVAGSFSMAIRGRATGLSDAVATIPITVTVPVRNVRLSFCSNNLPIWVATQDDQGVWLRALPSADGSFAATIGTRGGAAVAYDATYLEVTYATVRELNAIFRCTDVGRGVNQVRGTVRGLSEREAATVALGPAWAMTYAQSDAFTLNGVSGGPLDLVAVQRQFDPVSVLEKIVVRRYPTMGIGATLQPIDFGSQEAVLPASGTLTISGLSSAGASVFTVFGSANGSFATIYYGDGGTSLNYAGVPASLTAPGDLHFIDVGDRESERSPVAYRYARLYSRDVVNRNVALGPPVGVPTMTPIAGTNSQRWRVQLARQPEYGTHMQAILGQENQSLYRTVSLHVTSDYRGNDPSSTWDVSTPDLTAVAGFDPSWGLRPGLPVDWLAGAAGGGSFEQMLSPTDGQLFIASTLMTANAAQREGASVRSRSGANPGWLGSRGKMGLIARRLEHSLR